MTKDFSFKNAVARLEAIIAQLESPDLDLEESVERLTEAFDLHKKCQDKLKSAQSRIDKLLSEEINEQSKGGDL